MSIKTTSVLIFLCALCAPIFVSADVVINEIMYDLPGSDGGGEWVEIQNTGTSDIDLSYISTASNKHWKLMEGGNAFGIKPYSGGPIVPAGALAVIALDPSLGEWSGWGGILFDASASSFKDKGDSIALEGLDGAVLDTLDYTNYAADKQAAGDGNSLQRNGSSWIAAAPTPGAENATVAAPPAATSSEQVATTTPSVHASASAPVSSYVAPPVPTLFADAGDDRAVIVGADTEFDGRAYDRDDEDVDLVRFSWNFGDGSTAEGPSVLHHYKYPGRYAVVLSIAQNKTAVIDEFIVTAEPARLAFTANADGSVSIGNSAGHDLDLSGWIVRSFAQMFMLPEHSILLSNAALRIPQQTLGFYAGLETELDYPNGALAFKSNDGASQTPATARAPAAASAPLAVAPPVAAVRSNGVARSQPAIQQQPVRADTQSAAPIASSAAKSASTSQVAAAATTVGGRWYWWVALSLAALALGGIVLFVQNMKAGEWDIVEETPDRE